ncbi:hypothetical protein, conserved [Eimeria praecox]|uniref:Uncharacterized protein n=1 Tax=Eimeria praecox TaxID=51316 RepID=U6GAB4_9EIME|nr:hypothetical protein, conserved [Eimeria praecox]
MHDSNGEGNESLDGRQRASSLVRADTTSGPRRLASSGENEAGALSREFHMDNPAVFGLACSLYQRNSTESASEPKKRVVRLTLTEAAEEIKRLRRFERKMNAEIKQHEEEAKNHLEQITHLKQQIADNERAHREELASRTITYENETKKLKTQLKDTADELQHLQETSLPLVEARKLTFKALRKGRALQYMAQLYTNNSVLVSVKREALFKLLENAVGTEHAVFRATHGFACGVQSYTDSHLRLLRQEQLILLAENERLQAQIQEMQYTTENKRRDRILQQEAAVAAQQDGNWASQELFEKNIESMECTGRTNALALLSPVDAYIICTGSRSMGQGFQREAMESQGMGRMYSHSLAESIVHTMESAIKKTNVEYRQETIFTGCALVTSFVRTHEKAKVLRAFWILILSAKMQSRAKEIQALKEQLKLAQEQEAASGNRRYAAGPCRACHAWSVLSSELNQASELSTIQADRLCIVCPH